MNVDQNNSKQMTYFSLLLMVQGSIWHSTLLAPFWTRVYWPITGLEGNRNQVTFKALPIWSFGWDSDDLGEVEIQALPLLRLVCHTALPRSELIASGDILSDTTSGHRITDVHGTRL